MKNIKFLLLSSVIFLNNNIFSQNLVKDQLIGAYKAEVNDNVRNAWGESIDLAYSVKPLAGLAMDMMNVLLGEHSIYYLFGPNGEGAMYWIVDGFWYSLMGVSETIETLFTYRVSNNADIYITYQDGFEYKAGTIYLDNNENIVDINILLAYDDDFGLTQMSLIRKH